MLRLRQVELFGFKSFCDRTRILFNGTGVAAIVGPNGCGKSNIADAILWVLGEQSAKTLRSSRMADCIFNGTTSRPPTNLAEVSLTLVDPEAVNVPPTEAPPEAQTAAAESDAQSEKRRKNRLNLKILPGEVVVTRRLYRDATSEYYLNGEFCRLRDIQELFMGTGLGPESYAIIEQGRVGQILSSRPSDRRALLEEAAGVSKYKTRRRLAEAKLESARQNLLRVNDILEEISKQLNSLKRQASRARRYQELKAEGAELRRRLLATQLDRFRAAEAELAARLEAAAAGFERQSAALAALEGEQTSSQARQAELEAALRREQNRAGQVLVELERAQARLAEARRQQRELGERLTGLAGQRHAVADEAAQALAAAEQNRAALGQLEAQFAATAKQLEALGSETQGLGREIAALESSESTGENAAAPAVPAEPVQGEPVARARHLRQLTRQNLAAADEALARCQQELETEQGRVEELRRSLAAAAAQQHALSELVAQRAALAEPVQRLLLGVHTDARVGAGSSTGQLEFRAVGVVADFAEFEPDYAPLLEDYLHEEMEYVVVETYDAARTGVSLLRQQLAGRATFLVDSFGQFPPPLAPKADRPPQGRDLIGPVADFVRLNGALGSEAKRVLPKLARTYLVSSPRTAETLARDFPEYFFLATDGTCYHGRLVSGGARNGHGSHALQRQLEQATRHHTELEPLASSAEAGLRQRETRRQRIEHAREAARAALFAQETNLLQLEQQQEALAAARQNQTRLEAAATRLAADRQERSQLETRLQLEQKRLEQELPALEQDLPQRQRDKAAQESRCQELDAELAALRQRLLDREAALRLERARLDALRDDRHALEVERARLESERQHAEAAVQSEFGLTASQLLAQVAERLDPDALAQAEARYREIRERLETIGPINMMALEEFQECEQRHQFLTRQREDLLASIADTTGAIAEIDAVCRQQFEQAFAAINQNFEETFRTLFGGGTATLRLSEPAERDDEPGIELICQPPGKRLQNVLLLSGGEKALAALALLIAIFRYQPSPFCILDEVDAPLDDSNVGRFTGLIQQMAPSTQFILITHNKKTMEIAPVLYGVTMQAALSQIVSVRFDSSAEGGSPAAAGEPAPG